MSVESKTEIKNRMIKKAASLWGVQPNEIETSFDPVVSLLIAACASEISKISSEINNSQTRVTEQFVQLMTPETVYGTFPAHGIAYVEPTSPKANITDQDLFYYNKKTKNAHQAIKNIFFSPAQKTQLIGARISHIICGSEAYELEGKSKLDLPSNIEEKLSSSTIYLGIDSENDQLDLKNTSIFFEILDVQDRELFYHHLQQADFYINNEPIDVTPGYENSLKADHLDLQAVFSEIPNKTRNIENNVKKVYEKHFITIRSDVKLTKGNNTLEEITKFAGDEIENISDLHWIKIVFPRIISNATLKNVFCSFNAFPVLNRKLESISYQLKDYIDIVPLSTMDLFLDIKTVSNTSGQTYTLRENNTQKDRKGTYVVRKDNVGKLDSRKAKEYLLHLIELLKDESAAFSIYGNDFLQSNINKLNQNIATLEKKVSDMTKTVEERNYVFVKPYKKKDVLLVEYWTTNGDEANQIKTGSLLQSYKGSELKQKSGVFLTPTFQGKNALTMDERLYAYKRALLSRNRIVTKEDIKALCYELCGNKIKDIQITKTFRADIDLSKGMVPSIQIKLYPNASIKVSDFEWDAIKSNLLFLLEKQSLNLFPYHVVIDNTKKSKR